MGIGLQFGDTHLMMGILACVRITWIIIMIIQNWLCDANVFSPNYLGNIAFTVNIL